MNPAPDDLDALRTQARALQSAGRLAEAIQAQVRVTNAAGRTVPEQADDWLRLGTMLFAGADFSAAAQCFAKARELRPDELLPTLNLGLTRIRTGHLQEARDLLLQAHQREPQRLDVLDGLADVCGKLGDHERARAFGEQSLGLKDEAAMQAAPPTAFRLPEAPPAPFALQGAKANVIAFSLFGDKHRYIEGALRNALVAPYVYPGWRCRFYCDASVPADAREALARSGAEVVLMPPPQRTSDALFWRFLVAEDATVGRFLVRDCDAVVNARERAAVSEWLRSPAYFHVMRDYPSHIDLMLARMWGGVAGVLPPLARLLEGFTFDPLTQSRTVDQRFLGQRVWPLIRASCLIHDRCFRNFGARPFPEGSELPGQHHVGENDVRVRVGWSVGIGGPGDAWAGATPNTQSR